MNTWDPVEFQTPSKRYRPKMRWWLPGAFMNKDEIKREIEWMAEAGYGGAEILHFFPIPSADIHPSDYGRFVFGGDEWNNRMKAALEAAIPLNFQLDFTVGPLWPIATPAVMDKNDDRCTHGLHIGTMVVAGTYNGAIPVPDTVDPSRPYKLVAVSAARRYSGESIGEVVTLELDTAADLTFRVDDGRIKWTAPLDGEWYLFGFWSQTNGQMNDSIGAPAIDHFSKAAADAVTGYWDKRLFADPEILALYEKNAGNLFCDSIELNATMLGGMYGATPMPVAIWSPAVLEEFHMRRGYDLTPYLPSIFVKGLYQLGAGNRTDGDSDYDFADRSANLRIRNDFFQTLTDMFRDNHLGTIRRWANRHHMKLRYQTYGMPTELSSGLAEVDIPETESLGFHDSTDGYRIQSGAVHLYDREIYSIEVGAVMGYGYKQTWTGQDFGLLWQLHRGFAAGVNQAVLHGMSYDTSSASEHFEAMFKWPGLSLMGSRFSNEWGGRQPNSLHARALTDYIARTQYLLQLGKPKVDLAIYRYHIDGIHGAMGTELTPYEQAGFTYDFVSPCLLDLANAQTATFEGQSVLAVEGPAYRAIVVDMRKKSLTGDWRASDLPIETANQLIAFAESGLPVVVVGETPNHVASFSGSKDKMRAKDVELCDRIEHLLNLPTVRAVKTQEDVVAALGELSVIPAVQVQSESPLLNARRYENGISYYFIYNPSQVEAFEGEVQFKGTGNPFKLNAWDGTICPMAAVHTGSGQTTSKLRLAPNGTALIAVAEERTGLLQREKYRDTIAKGKRIIPDRWSLVVDSWTAGAHPTETKIERIELELDELRSWIHIPELRQVSGIGRYRTSFRIEERKDTSAAVILEMGEVSDTFRIFVNGQELNGVDQIGRHIPIGEYLRYGENNELEVEVATTLNNALSIFDPNREPLDCGLIGPVGIVLGEGSDE